MIKKLNKKFFILVLMVLGIIIIPTGGVKATLQANANTHIKKTDTTTNWMSNFRKMETTGGTMGLSEKLNSDLTSKEGNNIDVHMMRSTEYGAIAILSASGYGNSKTLQNSSIKTTTGNKTGVYFTGQNEEFVAGGLQGRIFSGVNGRYYDIYTDSNASARIGDALGTSSTPNPGCSGWHSPSYNGWVSGAYPYIRRDHGGIFSNNYGVIPSSEFSRGVAVCGTGL